DAALVQQALNDTNEELDQLPILQHALMRCWEKAAKRTRTGRPHLTLDDYTAIGGVKNGLSNHANEILGNLCTRPKAEALITATKRVFQALTETDRNRRLIRRAQRFGDLVRYVGTGPEPDKDPAAKDLTQTVVDEFSKCSFLRTPKEITNDSII